MDIGLLTARFDRGMSLERIARWAAGAGFKALEVTAGPAGHLRPAEVLADGGAAVRRLLDETGLRISSLAHYSTPAKAEEAPAVARNLSDVVKAAAVLGVPVVCTLAGFPIPGPEKLRSKVETIREFLPGFLGPVAEEAAAAGIKLAFENWFATNLQHLDCFRAVLEALPWPNVGFNFDPSHLLWQGIDYLAAVEEFKARIFHTHAKDVAIFDERLRRVGCLERGWWRYVIPGFGRVAWGEYVGRLRSAGYDGVLSIEHEDGAFGPEEGFEKGLEFLARLV